VVCFEFIQRSTGNFCRDIEGDYLTCFIYMFDLVFNFKAGERNFSMTLFRVILVNLVTDIC